MPANRHRPTRTPAAALRALAASLATAVAAGAQAPARDAYLAYVPPATRIVGQTAASARFRL